MKMVRMEFDVELATRDGLVPFAKGVWLEFPEMSGWCPMPKEDALNEAFRSQRPDLAERVPMFSETKRLGVCFSATGKVRRDKVG